MVAAKQPVKPTPATSAAKPTTAISNTTERRPSLPSLSPLPDTVPEPAATPQPVPATPQAVTPAKLSEPASAPAQATAAPVAPTKPAEKPVEKLGVKIRTRGEILSALRAGGRIAKEEGLFRIIKANGSKHPTSKRRVLSLETQNLLVASADGKTLTLNSEADKKASEPKADAAPKPTAEGTK